MGELMQDRKTIETAYKINTKDLFTSDEEFNKELTDLSNNMSKVTNYKGHIMDNANNLYNTLKLDTEISERIERLYIYAHLNNDFDLTDERGNDFTGKVVNLANDYESLTSYIIPELLKNDYALVEKYIKVKKELLAYENNLKNIYRLKDHTLNENEELILSKISSACLVPEEASSKLLDADLKFDNIKDEKGNSVKLSTSNYAKYIESSNRDVRLNAFKTFYKGYASVINTTATLLSSEVKNNNNIANIRKYNSALEASLISNEVDSKVYTTLLESINQHLDIIHKEWHIRKNIMHLNELHLYDTYVSLIPEYNASYTFDEGRQLVENALKILGDDYSNKIKEAFDNNWIDVYPTENKRSGGYCTCSYLAHPYVFLNFDNRYDEVSTIAHELGHAMHYYYAQTNNPYQNYNYSIFVAEVASQVNELLLSYYMLDNASSNKEKLFILDELIKRFKASVVRQSMFAEFEKNIHEYDQEGKVLTKEVFNDLYYQLNKKYYGNDVILDDEIKYEWSRIPHFYYDFYVYQYATGYISALKIASDIYNHTPNALNNYLKFLKLGNTKDPVTSLSIAGVDLTNPNTFDMAFKEFNTTMNKFENIYKGSEINGK
jgi:oligoendopeptidase F